MTSLNFLPGYPNYDKPRLPETVTTLAQNTKLLAQFMTTFFAAGYRQNQRMAVVLVRLFKEPPQLFLSVEEQLVASIVEKGTTVSVLRNSLRLLNGHLITKRFHGVASALGQLEWLTKLYPELLPEVRETVMPQLSHEKKSFQVRSRFLTIK